MFGDDNQLTDYQQDEIISDLGHELYNKISDEGQPDIMDLTTRSNCTGWGFDTFEDLETESDNPEEVKFSATLYLNGDSDDDRPSPYTSIKSQVTGKAELIREKWTITDYEISEADYNLID